MKKDTLYEEGQLKITYLHSPEPGRENEVISREDHELWIRDKSGGWSRYILQRGILRELAFTAKGHPLDLSSKLTTINNDIWNGVAGGRIILRDIERAFIGAYQKEEKEFDMYLAEQNKD